MKQFKLLTVLTMIMAIAVMGCDKDDDKNGVGGSAGLECTVDGTAWKATLTTVATYDGGLLTVTGSDSGGKQCQIVIHDATAPGSFTLGTTMNNQNYGRWTAGIQPEQSYINMLGQGGGTVEITELTASGAKGTFEFTAKNTEGDEVTITNGSFSVIF